MDIILTSILGIGGDVKMAFVILSYVWFIVFPPILFFMFKIYWMRHIQDAYWASADWVLLELIPPKNIEKSPKPMEALYAGFAGVEKTFDNAEKYIDGCFTDYMSLELVSDGGVVHFYIRSMKKFRHLVEAHLYAQYPDVEIIEVPDYVDDMPVVMPNSRWDLWGTDFIQVTNSAYPIRTYMKFEEDVTGTMIDPLSSVVEVMGKLGPEMKIWFQMIIQPTVPGWSAKEGKKLLDKLKGREKKEESILERIWSDLIDVFGNLFTAMKGPVEFPAEKKKDEQPLDTRLSPGERDVLKDVEDNLGKLQFYTKIRFILLCNGVRANKSYVSSFTGAIKQFNDNHMNGLKSDGNTKTSGDYVMKKSRLRYRQRKLFRLYKNRSMDGKTCVLSTEELATLFHFPDMNVMAPSISRVEAKRGGAPSNLPVE